VSTKSQTTITDYLDRVRTLLARYEKESSRLATDDWALYVEWLIQIKSGISHSTWRQYKAASVYMLEQKGQPALAALLFGTDSEGVLEESERTSAVKKKHITERQEAAIREYLSDKMKAGDPWFKPLLAYFESILAVGFRPAEIPNSDLLAQCEEFDGEGPVLRVKNAKATNGRSFAEYRYIGCSSLSKRQMILLELSINYAKDRPTPTGKTVTYPEFYKALQERFSRVNTRLFPTQKKRITLYSCRHQCIADLKHAGYTLSEIAVIVGHGNDITASEHYGKRQNGRSRSGLPVSNNKDIGKVKQLLSAKLSRRDSKRKKSPSPSK
jgi:hypothetical protein